MRNRAHYIMAMAIYRFGVSTWVTGYFFTKRHLNSQEVIGYIVDSSCMSIALFFCFR
jgi:hypothetical protein